MPHETNPQQSGALLSTASGIRWLDQFQIEDRSTAIELVGALHLVSASQFENWLKTKLELLLTAGEDVGVATVRAPALGFENLDAQIPGSEHRVAHTIQRLCGNFPNCTLNPSPSRANSLQRVVFVDDIMGSGTTMANYISAFHQSNKALASRYSRKKLRYTILAFSRSPFAESKYRKRLRDRKVKQLISDPPEIASETYDIIPSKALIQRITDLCRRYKTKLSERGREFVFGFKRTANNVSYGISRTVFEHGCPNNLPALLWDINSKWKGLFPGRHVPPDLAACFTKPAAPSLPSIEIDQLKPAPEHRYEILVRLAILDNLSSQVRSQRRLSQVANLPIETCRDGVDRCRQFGLIFSDRLALTPLGREQRTVLRRLADQQDPTHSRGASPSEFFFSRARQHILSRRPW